MRISLALVLAAAIAAAAFAVTRDDEEGATGSGSVTLVGDSLNVGTAPYLARELAGWRIEGHDRVGRTTSEGVEELRRLSGKLAPVVVVSLGTNDADGSDAEFRDLVAEALEVVGPDRCVIWATVVRDGVGRAAFDRVLLDARSEHANLRLVDWTRMVADDESLLAADLVHGTPDGYARRAAETARAVRACPRADG